MLFNSFEFIVFFPIVTLLYYLFPHKLRWVHLIIASCVFYAAFIPSYLLILFALIIIDYFAGLLIEKQASKKKWLIISIIANLGLLFIFKYYNFFISEVNTASSSHFPLLNIVLPIGLSFHTFQSLSYTIEVYRGRQKAIHHLGHYALYVMFYPQLVAGPIERPYNIFPQIQVKHHFSFQNLYEGLRLMAWGFFKKTVIADRLSGYVDMVFNSPNTVLPENIWIGILFFSIQVYADFSGYTDIALGSAKCMGFNLMINFNRPYQSTNIREFWKRWHISLSSWFRDYVYIPLGGNRKGKPRKYLNIVITFFLSGLWHGAGWTFIVWGLLHGLYIVVYDSFQTIFKKLKVYSILSISITLLIVGFAWIFFRANSLDNAFDIISRLTFPSKLNLSNVVMKIGDVRYGNFSMLFIAGCIVYMFGVERLTKPLMENLNKFKLMDVALFSFTILLIIFFGTFHKTSFIYFQF